MTKPAAQSSRRRIDGEGTTGTSKGPGSREGRIRAIYEALTADFQAHPAPVVDLIAAQGASPFHILVATMLSARTKDATTAKVIREQLFPVVHGPDDLRRLSVEEIERLIFPVGFFHAKAQYLKALPDALDAKFGGKLPETVEELCELPGVGRKTANLVVAQAFRKPGICVDVHVHRICNRLGLVETSTPLETEMRLRELLPVELWRGWNGAFVSFGQRLCTPRNPKCAECPIAALCPQASTPSPARSPRDGRPSRCRRR